VAVPPDRDPEPVRVFPTFTCDLEALADWLMECGITTMAMESTGVCWIPLYQILEDRGMRVCLVNARHMQNVPGRRTDWHECQWLQYLHTVGWLRAVFRPEQQVVAIRSGMRHRQRLVELVGVHVRHIHKALTHVVMNLPVLADIHPYERTSRVGLPEGFSRDSCRGRRWDGREADRVDARGVRWTERLRSGQPHLAGSEARGPSVPSMPILMRQFPRS
jgi:hypothetical protein